MKFERGKDTKEALRIGREEDLILRIDRALQKESSQYSDFYLDRTPRPNNPEIRASWIQKGTGYYFSLIKSVYKQEWTRDSQWPDYHIHYDLGLHYGNEPVENLCKSEL